MASAFRWGGGGSCAPAAQPAWRSSRALRGRGRPLHVCVRICGCMAVPVLSVCRACAPLRPPGCGAPTWRRRWWRTACAMRPWRTGALPWRSGRCTVCGGRCACGRRTAGWSSRRRWTGGRTRRSRGGSTTGGRCGGGGQGGITGLLGAWRWGCGNVAVRVHCACICMWAHAHSHAPTHTHTQVTQHLRACGSLSVEHNAAKLLKKCWSSWRKHVEFNQTKAGAVLKAMSFWLGRNLQVGAARAWEQWAVACNGQRGGVGRMAVRARGAHPLGSVLASSQRQYAAGAPHRAPPCAPQMFFAGWRRYVDTCNRNADHADGFYARHARHMVITVWHRAARKKRRCARARCACACVCVCMHAWPSLCAVAREGPHWRCTLAGLVGLSPHAAAPGGALQGARGV